MIEYNFGCCIQMKKHILSYAIKLTDARCIKKTQRNLHCIWKCSLETSSYDLCSYIIKFHLQENKTKQ